MAMVSTPDASAPAPRVLLRVAMIALAAVATLTALSDLPGVFQDYGHTTPLLIFAQRAISARLVLAPFIAGAALLLAVTGRLRHTIVALATLSLLTWITELPSVAIHGLELSASGPGLFLFGTRFIYPLIAVAAILLALRNERLPLAAALVSLPTILAWLTVVIFTIGIMIYGF